MESCIRVSSAEIDQLLTKADEQSKLSFCGKHGQPIPESMAKRNARERTRVHQLNATFDVLKKRLPPNWRRGRLSKCGILRKSTDYIRFLLHELGKPVDQEMMHQLPRETSEYLTNPNYGSFPENTPYCSEMFQFNTGWQKACESQPVPCNMIFSPNHGYSDVSLMETNTDPNHRFNFSSCMYERQNRGSHLNDLHSDSTSTQL